jgi:hypothetical protein|tara:strand:- start:1182 stop:1772 length:591 start_codon:yes stop_codon:yes gene_type:complete
MIIVDDFIKDQDLLDRMHHDKTFFGANGDFMWWNGWWNNEAKTIKQELIEKMWKYHSPWDFPRYKSIDHLVGFEYWTGIYGEGHPNIKLGWHLDKDEKHWKATGGNDGGEVVKPIMGTVYYPVETNFTGGHLEIQSSGDDQPSEIIEAKYNRLIIFEAGDLKHRVTEVTSGVRCAIAVNLWQIEPVGVVTGDFTIE